MNATFTLKVLFTWLPITDLILNEREMSLSDFSMDKIEQ